MGHGRINTRKRTHFPIGFVHLLMWNTEIASVVAGKAALKCFPAVYAATRRSN